MPGSWLRLQYPHSWDHGESGRIRLVACLAPSARPVRLPLPLPARCPGGGKCWLLHFVPGRQLAGSRPLAGRGRHPRLAVPRRLVRWPPLSRNPPTSVCPEPWRDLVPCPTPPSQLPSQCQRGHQMLPRRRPGLSSIERGSHHWPPSPVRWPLLPSARWLRRRLHLRPTRLHLGQHSLRQRLPDRQRPWPGLRPGLSRWRLAWLPPRERVAAGAPRAT